MLFFAPANGWRFMGLCAPRLVFLLLLFSCFSIFYLNYTAQLGFILVSSGRPLCAENDGVVRSAKSGLVG